MKYITIKLISIILLVNLLYSCSNKKENTTPKNKEVAISTNLKYATGFEILSFNGYKKLIIKAPYKNSEETFEYKLVKSNLDNDLNNIQIPVKSIVVTSTTHIPMLELLHSEDKLVGYPNTKYISSERTRLLIDEGKIKDLGNEENINTESLIDLKPELVVGFSINSNNKMFSTIEKLGIPVILNGAWLEETPLGRAEWIKMFGVLFDKEKEADSIFNTIEAKYLETKQIAITAKNTPTILSGGLFKDVWNLPAGESFEATFLKDANTNYLWKDSKGKGSLSLNIENVFEKGKSADIWISPSYFNSLDQLKKANEIYSQFKSYKNGEIYTFVNSKGPTGGLIYFELASARPDLVLKDLIKIVHPDLIQNYDFTFFEKLK